MEDLEFKEEEENLKDTVHKFKETIFILRTKSKSCSKAVQGQ